MKKVQATITLQVMPSAELPEGVRDGDMAVCCTGYAEGRSLLTVLDAAVGDAVGNLAKARNGEIPPAPKGHELRTLSRPPWRCPCDLARFEE